ncbi:MAG: SGNH/GDSL hydrolase family protein [Oscillospiraceae bacterium]|nr:SGNH/GDSL hydrolase family protein [Oscillospiraceae bacterium]
MNLTSRDHFNNRAIAVFGDSITHGANCPDIPAQSYIGVVKRKLMQNYGLKNYGYASMESSMWNSGGRYDELHQITQNTPWQELRDGKLLGTFALQSQQKGDSLTIALREPYAYAYVYAAPGSGDFSVSNGGKTPVTAVTPSFAKEGKKGLRSEPIKLGGSAITITALTDEPVTLCGMGYYNDLDGHVLNNYANNGLRLVGISDEILEIMAKVDTAIFSLGYNDSHFPTDTAEFTRKIDLLIAAFNRHGTKLYVNDLCWNLPESDHFRSEIKRLAQSVSHAVRVPQVTEIAERELLDGVGAHPNVEGHGLQAAALIAAMEL